MSSPEDLKNAQKESITLVEGNVAHCQGDAASAHPGVYLHLNTQGEVICPYCSHMFKHKE